MKESILQAYHNALKAYTNKHDRGYKFGLFSTLRHRFAKSTKLENLENHLNQSKSDDEAINLIINHLLSINSTFNNHSFNSYLIDELNNSVPHIAWNCLTPKAIHKYEGALYRGTSQPPEKIFQIGFQELSSSKSIEDYLKFKNNSTGISTSKDFDTAMEYALDNKRRNKTRYVYVINYRDKQGYDILETGKARGLSFHRVFHKDRYSGWRKREVNIKNTISNHDIIGTWKVEKNSDLIWIENPNYILERTALLNMKI